jgi:hypothetical protein
MPVKAWTIGDLQQRASVLFADREAWYRIWHDTAELLVRPPIIGNMTPSEVRAMYSERLDAMTKQGLAPPFGWVPSAAPATRKSD